MGTRRRHALGIFLATAALCAVLVMPGSAAAQTELLPDLQGQEATGLQVSSSGGARELRLSTTIANGGGGTLRDRSR